MICDSYQKWPLIFVTLAMANPQFPMPYPMVPQQPMVFIMQPSPMPLPTPKPMSLPMAMPLPMPMHVGIALVDDEQTTTKKPKTTEKPATTDTTIATDNSKTADKTKESKNDNIAVAIPMPMSLPMQMPMPMPMPMPAPSPFLFPGPAPMPYPGYPPNAGNFLFVVSKMNRHGPHGHSKENSNGESSESNSCENSNLRKGQIRRMKHNNYGVFSKSNRRLDIDRSDDVIAEPVLHFITPEGEVRMRRPLNRIDASILMSEDDDSMQNIPVKENDFSNKHEQLRSRKGGNDKKQKRVFSYKHEEKGRKHLVFRPPPDMLVGNLSVSFNT